MHVDWKVVGGVTLSILLTGCGSSNNSQTSSLVNTLPSGTLAKAMSGAYSPSNVDPSKPTPAVACNSTDAFCVMTPGAVPFAYLQQFQVGANKQVGLNSTVSTTSNPTLIPLSGCDVTVYRIEYNTTYPTKKGMATAQPSAAIFVPSGTAANCSGSRPIVEYAHGTAVSKYYDQALNLEAQAQMAQNGQATNDAFGESLLEASTLASQGYIVVAPNYVGYNTDTATYHPYINASAESTDMLSALAAARQAISVISKTAKFNDGSTNPNQGIADDGKLFITGYSEGGFVAMATMRALQNAGTPATAGAALSGPYATEAFGDTVFNGAVGAGSTIFASMMLESYENLPQNALPGSVLDSHYQGYADAFFPAPVTYALITATDPLNPSPFLASPQFTETPSATSPVPKFALFEGGVQNSDGGTQNSNLQALNAFQSTLSGGPSPFLAGLGLSNPVQSATTPLSYQPYFLVSDSERANYIQDEMANPDGAGASVTSYDQSNNMTKVGFGGITGLASFTDSVLTNPTQLANYFTSANLEPAANPMDPLRYQLKANDLRDYVPKMPLLMCGGAGDPTVFFLQNSVLTFGKMGQAQAAPINPLSQTVALNDLGNPEADIPTYEANQALSQTQSAAGSFQELNQDGHYSSLASNWSTLRQQYFNDLKPIFDSAYASTPDKFFGKQLITDLEYERVDSALRSSSSSNTYSTNSATPELASYYGANQPSTDTLALELANFMGHTPSALFGTSPLTDCGQIANTFNQMGSALVAAKQTTLGQELQLAALFANPTASSNSETLGCAVIAKAASVIENDAVLKGLGTSNPFADTTDAFLPGTTTPNPFMLAVAGIEVGAVEGAQTGARGINGTMTNTSTKMYLDVSDTQFGSGAIDATMVLGSGIGASNGLAATINGLVQVNAQIGTLLQSTSLVSETYTNGSNTVKNATLQAALTNNVSLSIMSAVGQAIAYEQAGGYADLGSTFKSDWTSAQGSYFLAAPTYAHVLAGSGAKLGVQAILPNVHGTFEPPYCLAMAKQWFSTYGGQ